MFLRCLIKNWLTITYCKHQHWNFDFYDDIHKECYTSIYMNTGRLDSFNQENESAVIQKPIHI